MQVTCGTNPQPRMIFPFFFFYSRPIPSQRWRGMTSTLHSPFLPEVFTFEQNVCPWTSLVAQWIRIHLPVQGTWVGPLVQEDLTCHGATKPVRHNYWTCALEPMRCSYWSLQAESLCSATREARALQLQSSPWAAMKTRCNHKFKK